MQFKLLFHLRWTISLLFCMIFSHSVSALTVDFSTTPSSGPSPLLVTLKMNVSLTNSPTGEKFFIKNYNWEVTGPQTVIVPWNTETIIWLETPGEYTIKLTLTEFALEKEEPKVVNGQTVVDVFEVTRTDCATKKVQVGNVPSTPVTDQGCLTTDRKPVGQEVVDDGNSGDSGDPIGDLIGGGQIEPPPEPTSIYPELGPASGATFYGGVNKGGILPNGSSFGSTEEVNVTVDLKVASEHVGQQGDILVAVEYFPTGNAEQYFPKDSELEEFGEFYFKTESTVFPFVRWDVKLGPPMIPAESSVTLETMHNIPVFSGHLKNLPGTYKIYFGYRFQQNEVPVFVHNYPNYPLTFTVTP